MVLSTLGVAVPYLDMANCVVVMDGRTAVDDVADIPDEDDDDDDEDEEEVDDNKFCCKASCSLLLLATLDACFGLVICRWEVFFFNESMDRSRT